MLGVDQYRLPVVAQVGYGIGHHVQGFRRCRPQCFDYVPRGRFGHEAYITSPGGDQVGHHRVGLSPASRLPGGTKGHQPGIRQHEPAGGRSFEKFLVFRVRPRPTTLYVVDAKQVELFGHSYFVCDGKGKTLSLATVTQRRVKDFHSVYLPARAHPRAPPLLPPEAYFGPLASRSFLVLRSGGKTGKRAEVAGGGTKAGAQPRCGPSFTCLHGAANAAPCGSPTGGSPTGGPASEASGPASGKLARSSAKIPRLPTEKRLRARK